jgi:hypothetical protein
MYDELDGYAAEQQYLHSYTPLSLRVIFSIMKIVIIKHSMMSMQLSNYFFVRGTHD